MRSKIGKRFGFVRFVSVKNEESFSRSLATIWIGSFNMYASVARFQRQEKAGEKPKKETVKVADRVKKQACKVISGLTRSSPSYVFVLNGGVGRKGKGNGMEMKTITLTDHELVHIINSLEVALVKSVIATNQIKFISEVVKVVIHGEEYDVHIHELGFLSINMDHLCLKNPNSDSKVDVEFNNEEDSRNEGDLHGLFQEEQVETTENDKRDMDVNG
uniref:RNA-directed DNA polymerase, eukaryota, nucleotide-binding alpha-beta plait domain protein n=1 Tax=Tanacetum cinerariifolium TaxID=118510 RepID=A0A699GS83_TANCI|nr:RNA-directed DNA polymerase, eukaryota, nucleotide-binding alpha-beta plait domain protein [Tanacetum cinerariifolium]